MDLCGVLLISIRRLQRNYRKLQPSANFSYVLSASTIVDVFTFSVYLIFFWPRHKQLIVRYLRRSKSCMKFISKKNTRKNESLTMALLFSKKFSTGKRFFDFVINLRKSKRFKFCELKFFRFPKVFCASSYEKYRRAKKTLVRVFLHIWEIYEIWRVASPPLVEVLRSSYVTALLNTNLVKRARWSSNQFRWHRKGKIEVVLFSRNKIRKSKTTNNITNSQFFNAIKVPLQLVELFIHWNSKTSSEL